MNENLGERLWHSRIITRQLPGRQACFDLTSFEKHGTDRPENLWETPDRHRSPDVNPSAIKPNQSINPQEDYSTASRACYLIHNTYT